MEDFEDPSVEQVTSVPYAERWELLKTVILRLFIEEQKKLKDVVKIMELRYKFFASVNQYTRQFGIWKVKKSIPTKQKIKISKAMETRAKQGKSSTVLHNGMDENHKLRRFMKERARNAVSMPTGLSYGPFDLENLSGHALQCGNRVLMNWSIPGSVVRFLRTKSMDNPSPCAFISSPMNGIQVTTPFSDKGPSPQNHPSPQPVASPREPSTMTATVRESLKISRAALFLQRNHNDLLNGMNIQEQCITTEWMHQLWQFSYTTARTWNRGPQHWNATNLKFDLFPRRIESLPSTPSVELVQVNEGSAQRSSKDVDKSRLPRPSPLCKWSIHYVEPNYERILSPDPAEALNAPDDEATWRPWVERKSIHEFAESIQENLKSNDFSTINSQQLPISASHIVRAIQRSPEQLLEEAFGFSIMARNIELVSDMFDAFEGKQDFTLHELYPLHLATSYLSGAGTCCNLFDVIVQRMATGETSIRKLYANHLSHTVLDNLMIAILKGHTSCTPRMVDEAFKKEYRFAGEEVDICGRWDADSDCIRQLQACGNATIPQNWKHMFCHTSVQTITHCIGSLFSPHWGPDINTPSGLFSKRCLNEDCGLKLQLKPLHALVVTAVYLAQLGSQGETLFGMVACLLCLLGKGANPLLRAHISPTALLTDDDSQGCTHSELDPLELAQSVPEALIVNWSDDRVIGWRLLCTVLRLSQDQWNAKALSPPAQKNVQDHPLHDIRAFIPYEAVDDPETLFSSINYEMNGTSEGADFNSQAEEDEGDDDIEGVPAFCEQHYETEYQRNYFGKNKALAALWASVQTELLTYRRLAEGDPWISPNFDMASVLNSLETGTKLSIPLVANSMMKSFCRCGVFDDVWDPVCVRSDEACSQYFSNLEDYSRTTLLSTPQREGYWDPY